MSICVQSAHSSRVDAIVEGVLARIARDRYQRKIANLDLGKLYVDVPQPGSAHLFKVVVYSPASRPESSVVMTNLADGWSSLMSLVAAELGGFQMQVVSSEDGAKYPMNRFEVWRDGQSRRIVMTMKDSDRWIFLQQGAMEPFEEPAQYDQVTKKNRLTREILISYLKRTGWVIDEEHFWVATGSAVYFEEIWKSQLG